MHHDAQLVCSDAVRTTITIDEHLLDEVRQVAAARRQTVSQVIEESVRESLLRRGSESRASFELRTFHAGGYQAGVDLDDNASLLELMDQHP
jgi:predicted transcriptional regulator